MAGAMSKKVRSMSKFTRHAGFGGKRVARDLPHERQAKDAEEVPGPGQYEAKSSVRDAYNSAHNSAFSSGTQRSHLLPGWKSEVKDPGEYEPNAHRDMSALAKHSFSRSGSAGTMDF